MFDILDRNFAVNKRVGFSPIANPILLKLKDEEYHRENLDRWHTWHQCIRHAKFLVNDNVKPGTYMKREELSTLDMS